MPGVSAAYSVSLCQLLTLSPCVRCLHCLTVSAATLSHCVSCLHCLTVSAAYTVSHCVSCLHYCYYCLQESYHKPIDFKEQRDTLEEQSPEYLNDDCLFQHRSLPDNNATCDVQASAQSPAVVAGGDAWVAAYKCDVQKVAMRVNHHIHRVSDVTKEREPMPYCRCKDKPHECSKGYPKTKIDLDSDLGGDRGAVVCKGLASRFNLKSTGSRSMLGAIKTQRNNEWLNGTHPALRQ